MKEAVTRIGPLPDGAAVVAQRALGQASVGVGRGHIARVQRAPLPLRAVEKPAVIGRGVVLVVEIAEPVRQIDRVAPEKGMQVVGRQQRIEVQKLLKLDLHHLALVCCEH